jgi:hypothetical protein
MSMSSLREIGSAIHHAWMAMAVYRMNPTEHNGERLQLKLRELARIARRSELS